MGLDVSHGCWNGSYSGFMKFRKILAGSIDIDLENMAGFSRGEASELWENRPDDDLHILLRHSDCDGEIPVSDAKKLLLRMRNHRDAFILFDDSTMPFISKYDYWISGLECAISNNEVIEFL